MKLGNSEIKCLHPDSWLKLTNHLHANPDLTPSELNQELKATFGFELTSDAIYQLDMVKPNLKLCS